MEESSQIVEEEIDTKKVWEDFFNRNKPKVLIHPIDFLEESQIFIERGSLNEAFQILVVATSRGHLENIAIVLQMWTILTRLNREKDANDCINFLISAMTVESGTAKAPVMRRAWRDRPMLSDGGIPMYFVFLHCINHLMNKSLQTRKLTLRKQILSELHALLGECYFLYHGDKMDNLPKLLTWFNDWNIWMEMGEYCENSVYLLLAEDSYYEAFRRKPLSNLPIMRIVESMERYQREGTVPHLLTKAVVINPWNVYLRTKLQEYELKLESNDKNHHWRKLFDSEHLELRKVQSLVRGWLLRCWWSRMLPRLREIRAAFLSRISLSTERYEMFWRSYLQVLYGRWVEYKKESIRQKHASALKIQSLARMRSKVKLYQALLERCKQANGTYLVACQLVYNLRRISHMRGWFEVYLLQVKQRAATVITDVLWLHGYNQLLVKGMNEVMIVLRVRYKHLKRRVLASWSVRFNQRKVVRAKTTIRFFVRNIFTNLWEREQEAKLKVIEELVAEQKEVAYISKQLPIMRTMWSKWRAHFLFILQHKKTISMAFTLQHCFYAKKARAVVLFKRARKECQVNYMLRRLFLRKYKVFETWRRGQASRVIQRFVRVRFATRVLRRLQKIHRGMLQMIKNRQLRTKEEVLWKCSKFVYLKKRERLRGWKKMVNFFQRQYFLSVLRRMLIRKMRYIPFARSIHRMHTKKCFQSLYMVCFHKAKYAAISSIFYWVLIGTKQSTWNRLFKQINDQKLILNLQDKLINNKIDQNFWNNAHRSVRILFPDEETLVAVSKLDGIALWEQIIPPSKVLLGLRQFNLSKAFRAYMAVYRVSHHYRRGSAVEIAKSIMKGVICGLALRREKVVYLQCLSRRYAARIKYSRNVMKSQRMGEYVIKKEMLWQKIWFMRAMVIARKRQVSRLKIQQCIRIYLAMKRSKILRQAADKVAQCFYLLNNSRMQSSLIRKFMSKWHSIYIKEIVLKLARKDFDFDDYLIAYRKLSKSQKRPFVYHVDDNHDDSEEEDELDNKWKKLNKYQKKLQHGANKAKPLPTKAKATLSSKVQSHFPSASAMYFQSSSFHAAFSHLSRSGVFTLHSSLLSQLAPQEIYYCLFHCEVAVVQDVNAALLKYVCEGFQGKKVILCNGKLSLKMVEDYLNDLCTERIMLRNMVLDRSKWPLTLPSATTRKETSSGLCIIFQSVSIPLLVSLKFAHSLHQHFEESVLQSRLTSYDNQQMDLERIWGMNGLSIDIESFGWSAAIILLHSVALSPYLHTLTIEHMGRADETKIPESFETVFNFLAKHSKLQLMVLRGWFPVSIYFALAGILQSPSNFPYLSKLELQSHVDRQPVAQQEEEIKRLTAVELLIDLAKMRAYSSAQVGLSIVADFV